MVTLAVLLKFKNLILARLGRRALLFFVTLFTVFLTLFVPINLLAQVETDFSAGGGVKIGDSGDVCDGTLAGAIRYNDAGSDTLDYCNGVSWLSVLTNAVTGIVDGGNATGAAITIGTNDNFALNFETNGTVAMTIDNAGNVGIGTTSPITLASRLSIYKNASNIVSLVGSSNINTTRTGVELSNNLGERGGFFTYNSGQPDIGVTAGNAVSLYSENLGPLNLATTSNTPQPIRFYTGGGLTANEKMRIDGNGNVGIGTIAPAVELDVNTGTINAASICDENNANCLDLSAGVGGDPSYGSSASSPNDAVYVDDNGRLGIGTTVPAKDLHVVNADGVGYAEIEIEGNATTRSVLTMSGNESRIFMSDINAPAAEQQLRIYNSGGTFNLLTSAQSIMAATQTNGNVDDVLFQYANVGIGTANAQAPLDVQGNGWFRTTGASNNIWSATHGAGTSQFSMLKTNGTQASPTPVVDNDQLGQIRWRGDYGGGNSTAARIQAVVDGTPSGVNVPSELLFAVNDGTATIDQMILSKNGYLGIGTTAPDVELDVNTGTINAAQVCDENNANCLDLSAGVGGDPSYGSSASSPNDAVFVDDSGNVGIGTSTPGAALHVMGRIRANNGSGNDIVLEDGAGNRAFRSVRTGAYSPSQQNTYFQIGPSSDENVIFSGHNGGGMDRTQMHTSQFFVNAGTGFLGTTPPTGLFQVNNSTDSVVMNLLDNGNVGIGTTAPAQKLHVYGTQVGDYLPLRIENTDNTSGSSAFLHLRSATIDGYMGVSVDNEFTFATGAGDSNVDYVWEVDTTERMRLLSSGFLGIGTSAPNVELDVIGDIEFTGVITDVSDRRLKENIRALENPLETLLQIDGVSFVMKDDPKERTEYGVIAQDVEKVLPALVSTANDERQTKSVNYMGFIGWIIEAVKTLAFENQDQGDDIRKLKDQVRNLASENQELEKKLSEKDKALEDMNSRLEKLESILDQ